MPLVIPPDFKKFLKRKVQNLSLEVGVMSSQKYEDGTPVEEVAVYQEFGTRTIPPRPFLRPAMYENINKWHKIFTAEGLKEFREFGQQADLRKAMDLVGMVALGDIKKSIKKVSSPPLALSTIANRIRGAKKGKINAATATKPLIHTGLLLNSINYEVKS